MRIIHMRRSVSCKVLPFNRHYDCAAPERECRKSPVRRVHVGMRIGRMLASASVDDG